MERIVAAIGVTLELTSTEWSEMAMETAERLLAEHSDADVVAALGRCQREVRGRLRLADIVERLPRRPAGVLGDYQRGYRDGLFGHDRPLGETLERKAGYEAGTEERLRRRALAPPAQRHEGIRAGPRRVGTFKRPEIPAAVRALLPAPPTAASEGQGASVGADSDPGQGVGRARLSRALTGRNPKPPSPSTT